jgi:hypothetical protein
MSKNKEENPEGHAVQAARDHSRWRDERKQPSGPKTRRTRSGNHAHPAVRFDSRW